MNPETTSKVTACQEFTRLPMSWQQRELIESSSNENNSSTQEDDGETVYFCREEDALLFLPGGRCFIISCSSVVVYVLCVLFSVSLNFH